MPPGRDLALVTGASSGIGAEIARQLASQKIDLVLTARRRDRLESLAAEIISKHSIQATIIEADLNTTNGANQLIADLNTKNVAITHLINNAGFGYYGPFLDQSPADIDAMLEVDIRAVTILCQKLGKQMAGRGGGKILNVASFAALAPIPNYTVYSGAKAYVVAFSQALRHELKNKNVCVSVLCPGFTKTEFHQVSRHKKSSLMRSTELSVEQVARAGLRGLQRNQFLIIPGWWYKLNFLTASFLPRSLMSALSAASVK